MLLFDLNFKQDSMTFIFVMIQKAKLILSCRCEYHQGNTTFEY